ncbi:hypothetical protein VHUM_01096 [Vanrija humicola]|uniref:Uncharacterized protein n=1 Tax=Vanrija humicola TaxID=5417 RepID=A0A7D8Z3A5_VANHU|nr:hypothetical protein VHUM_01096 [Vanrija humicola]
MSRASKIFFGASMLFMGGTVYGVHWLQKRESDNMYLGVLRDEERVNAKKAAQVLQPAAVVDEDCATCVISPPPQLLEAQTKEQRAKERAARLAEYEAQKGLAVRLEAAESGSKAPTPQRVV